MKKLRKNELPSATGFENLKRREFLRLFETNKIKMAVDPHFFNKNSNVNFSQGSSRGLVSPIRQKKWPELITE